MHRQIKTSDIISRRCGDLMTPLSRVQMGKKLTNASSRVTTDLHTEVATQILLWRVFSVKIQIRISDMLFFYSNIQSCN